MLKVLLVCRSCGYVKDLENSEDPLPDSCPVCGSKDLEFMVLREKKPAKFGEEKISSYSPEYLNSLVREAFLKQISPGEWEIDLGKTISEDVSIAEIEPGEYEVVFKVVKKP